MATQSPNTERRTMQAPNNLLSLLPPSPDTGRGNNNLHNLHRQQLHNNSSAVSLLYKRAIINALQELQDYHHRSNLDCIRRKAQASMEVVHEPWNETMFLKALKNLLERGEIEKCNPAHGHIATCELSPEMKRKVTSKAQQVIHENQQQQRLQLQLQQLQQIQYELERLQQIEDYQRQIEYTRQIENAREQFYRLPPQVTSLLPPSVGVQQNLPLMTAGPGVVVGGGNIRSNSISIAHMPQQQHHKNRRHSFDASSSHMKQNVEKEPAAKKIEHSKEKIIPKKLYDHMFVPIKNPMQTD